MTNGNGGENVASVRSGNLVLGGVGGQGIITASNTISYVCIEAGLNVKKSEVHGMSQRGGAVVSHLRFGPEVHSVIVEPGQAEWILGFEWEEGLRYLEYLKPGGVAFVSTERRIPPSAQVDRRGGKINYPLDSEAPVGVVPVDTYRIVGKTASERTPSAQTVLLGALSVEMGLPVEIWHRAIEATVPPKTVKANLLSFENGRNWYEERKGSIAARQGASSRSEDFPNRSTNGNKTASSGIKKLGNSSEAAMSISSWMGGTPRVEITRAWCKGCNICVSVCPERVLSIDSQEIAVVSEPDRCTGCGLCARLCPDLAIDILLDAAVNDELVQSLAKKRGDNR